MAVRCTSFHLPLGHSPVQLWDAVLRNGMWLNAAALGEAAEGRILGLPDFAEGQLSPRAGFGGPWHPRAHVLKLLAAGWGWEVGMCVTGGVFCILPIARRSLVLSELSGALPLSLRRRCTHLSLC